MRRSLVLTNESARHPFRASLPARPLDGQPIDRRRAVAGLTMQDLRDFLIAYCACFVVVSGFIA